MTGRDMRAGNTRMRGAGIAVLCACAIGLIGAPAANAAFELTNVSATPADNNAGANSDFSISLDTPDASDMKDLTIHLPPGLVGNPLATTTCTEDQLNADECPPASDVGDVSNDVTLTVMGFLPVAQAVNGNLYNVVPRAGEPARFGIVLNALPFNVPILGPAVLPPIILQSGAVLRQSDLGLDTILNDLPNTAQVAGMETAVHINSTSLSLSGQVGTPPKGFLRNPTSCKTHTVGFDAVNYDGATATASTTFDTVNCAAEPFTPEFTANIKVGKSTDAVELSTTIAQTIEEAGLQRAQVILPKDLFGNAAALAISCPTANFEAGTCPTNTIVGDAVAGSPLQAQPLAGPVALVAPASPGLPDLGLDLRGALALKLKGTIGVNAETRNIVTFDGLPDIPISNFTLTFGGGPNGLNTATRDLCKPPAPVFDVDFTSFSGATLHQAVPATVDCSGATGGGGGGGGGNNNRKPPTAKISLQKNDKNPKMSLTVRKGSEKLRSVKLTLPKQLRFGSDRKFDRGAKVRGGKKIKVKHTRSSLSLRAKKPVGQFAAKFKGKALKAKGVRGKAQSKFKLTVVDKTGKRTKLTVRPK